MRMGGSMFNREILTLRDIEELNYLAEEVIVDLKYCNPAYVGEAYLDFRENEELQKLTFQDALGLTLREVKEKYIGAILPIAREICRKDPQVKYGMVVSDEVDDAYLDNLLALRWKENLKLWTIQWDMMKRC